MSIALPLTQLRYAVSTATPFVLLALALLAVAYWLLDPNPPRQVTLATGAPQGAYSEFGERYAARLKRHGIQVAFATRKAQPRTWRCCATRLRASTSPSCRAVPPRRTTPTKACSRSAACSTSRCGCSTVPTVPNAC